MPQTSVIWAFLGGLITFLLIHVCAMVGYVVPPDIASGLPAAIAVVLAHYVPDRVK